MTDNEMIYFEQMPALFPLYAALRDRLDKQYANLRIKVSKTQISFFNRYLFMAVSLPWRKIKNWPKEYLLISFGLSYQKISPRIARTVEASQNRWTHHVILRRADEIDEELLGWINEAYQFSMSK